VYDNIATQRQNLRPGLGAISVIDRAIASGTIPQEIEIDDRSMVGLSGNGLKKLFGSIDFVNSRSKSPGGFF
jgi:hypothetical protein